MKYRNVFLNLKATLPFCEKTDGHSVLVDETFQFLVSEMIFSACLMLSGFVATRHKFEFIRLSMNENGNFTELFQSKIAIQGQP